MLARVLWSLLGREVGNHRVQHRPALVRHADEAVRERFDEADALELFDLAGRRVWGQSVASLGVGTHRIAIGDRVKLPAGVYLVRFTHASVARTTRAVVLE